MRGFDTIAFDLVIFFYLSELFVLCFLNHVQHTIPLQRCSFLSRLNPHTHGHPVFTFSYTRICRPLSPETYSTSTNPSLMGSSLTILSASPTCLRSLISRFLKRLRIAARIPSVNPWVLPLMTASCYCRGSELEERRLRCR